MPNMGSAWEHDGDLSVGDSSEGDLKITAGGKMQSAQANVGCIPGSIGKVTVDGPDSTWSSTADLLVGNFGEGTLKVTAGGKVDASPRSSEQRA